MCVFLHRTLQHEVFMSVRFGVFWTKIFGWIRLGVFNQHNPSFMFVSWERRALNFRSTYLMCDVFETSPKEWRWNVFWVMNLNKRISKICVSLRNVWIFENIAKASAMLLFGEYFFKSAVKNLVCASLGITKHHRMFNFFLSKLRVSLSMSIS